MATTQNIETLINLIETAEEAGSITNEMVSEIFSFLNGCIKSLTKALPPEGVVSGEVRPPEVYGNVIHLPLVIRRPDGGSTIHRVELPAATAEKAGLFDLATRKAVNEAIQAALTVANSAGATAADAHYAANRADASANAAQSTADDALSRAIAAKSAADNAQATADAAMTNADDAIAYAESETAAINSRVGAPGGIAPLNSMGMIEARFLPSYLDDIVEFAGRVNGDIDISNLTPPVAQMDGSETVVYSTFHARFLLKLKGAYYKTWPGYETYGDTATSGVRPVSGKIYVDTATDTLNRWSGSGLRELPAVLVLGTDAGQAFPGDSGTALQEAVRRLSADLESHRLTSRLLTGTLPPVNVNDMMPDVRRNVLDIHMPAGLTYELTVSDMNVTRLDMRVLRADNQTWDWPLFKITPGQPRRFTLAHEAVRVAFSAWDDMDAQVNYAEDFQVIMTFTLRRVEPWELAASSALDQ